MAELPDQLPPVGASIRSRRAGRADLLPGLRRPAPRDPHAARARALHPIPAPPFAATCGACARVGSMTSEAAEALLLALVATVPGLILAPEGAAAGCWAIGAAQ